MTRGGKRVLEFGLYISIGLALVAGILISAEYLGPLTEGNRELIGLAVTTTILFGYVVKGHKAHIGQVSFWLVLLAMLFIHVFSFALVLRKVKDWNAFWFIPFYPIEFFLIYAVFRFTGHNGPAKQQGRGA